MTERSRPAVSRLDDRAADDRDAHALQSFECGDEVFSQEVEAFIREHALIRHQSVGRPLQHRLLVFHSPDGDLVAAAAHRPTEVPFPPGTAGREAGSRLVFAAVNLSYQGQRIVGGTSIARTMMKALLVDVACTRTGRLVDATAHVHNKRSLALCHSFGLDVVQRRGDYVQLLGALPTFT